MKAVNDFGSKKGLVDPDCGHVVFGASKRGWTTWMVGAAGNPDGYPKIQGILPLVPIVPTL